MSEANEEGFVPPLPNALPSQDAQLSPHARMVALAMMACLVASCSKDSSDEEPLAEVDFETNVIVFEDWAKHYEKWKGNDVSLDEMFASLTAGDSKQDIKTSTFLPIPHRPGFPSNERNNLTLGLGVASLDSEGQLQTSLRIQGLDANILPLVFDFLQEIEPTLVMNDADLMVGPYPIGTRKTRKEGERRLRRFLSEALALQEVLQAREEVSLDSNDENTLFQVDLSQLNGSSGGTSPVIPAVLIGHYLTSKTGKTDLAVGDGGHWSVPVTTLAELKALLRSTENLLGFFKGMVEKLNGLTRAVGPEKVSELIGDWTPEQLDALAPGGVDKQFVAHYLSDEERRLALSTELIDICSNLPHDLLGPVEIPKSDGGVWSATIRLIGAHDSNLRLEVDAVVGDSSSRAPESEEASKALEDAFKADLNRYFEGVLKDQSDSRGNPVYASSVYKDYSFEFERTRLGQEGHQRYIVMIVNGRSLFSPVDSQNFEAQDLITAQEIYEARWEAMKRNFQNKDYDVVETGEGDDARLIVKFRGGHDVTIRKLLPTEGYSDILAVWIDYPEEPKLSQRKRNDLHSIISSMW